MDSDFLKLSKHIQKLVNPILKFSIFELKSLFISGEFSIPGVIAFYAFLRQLKTWVDKIFFFLGPWIRNQKFLHTEIMYTRSSDDFQQPLSILHSSEIYYAMFNSMSVIQSYAKYDEMILFDGHVIDIECSFLPQYG